MSHKCLQQGLKEPPQYVSVTHQTQYLFHMLIYSQTLSLTSSSLTNVVDK